MILFSIIHMNHCIDLKGLYGDFASPGFPNPYPNNIKRIWNILVSPGHRIRLYFTHFDLEPSHLCEYDYVQILSGTNETARFCGQSGIDIEDVPGNEPLYSATNSMTVVFRSDYSNEKRFTGFRAFYAAEDINECQMMVDGEPICDHNCHNYVGGYYCSCKMGYFLHSDKRTCTVNCSTQLFTERSGELMSPEFPAPYPKLSTCEYRIRVEEGFTILLEFVESFDVETHPEVRCPYDILMIKTQKQDHGPFCGATLPAKINTNSYEVDITFKTDGSGSNTGWKIKYTTTAMPCPDPVTPAHGRLSPKQAKYIFKDRFVLTCDRGYELLWGNQEIPSFEAVCQKNGIWDKPMPKCSLVDCTQPDDIANGRSVFTTTVYQSVVQYSCNTPFYVMEGPGDGKYTCDADGYWKNVNGHKVLPVCIPSCGQPMSGKLARIIGGTKAEKNELPWQVLVMVGPDFKGGAALLHDYWVLTAAHVLQDYGDVSNVQVKMGLINRFDDTDAVIRSAEKIFIHEKYKGDNVNYDHDIAMIRLKSSVPMSESTMPICLPGKQERFFLKAEDMGLVSGWGVTRKSGLGRGSNSLHYVELPVVDFEKCKEAYKGKVSADKEPLIITENMVCAGLPQGGKDSCSGDSGGPFVFYDEEDKKWFIGGIVSWGLECAKAGQYGLYTKVTNYLSWIDDIISKNK
ncbi:MASP2 protease, partial [Polypterus senegalus]|nr:MASP2 protease [Polypterus senegalus]